MVDRKNISQPSEYWREFERAAGKEDATLSEWIAEACLRRLPVSVRKRLEKLGRRRRGRPEKN